ncbi:MAG TPA: glycogen-binding domain-containing protein [Candidatus Omnitrophota bacterium]|nr:glycogen-binding domain-containing protein [Candidatus Omnitrophota bacterium]
MESKNFGKAKKTTVAPKAVDSCCSSSKSSKKKVDFELFAPEAKTVVVTGSFSSWDTKGVAMAKNKSGLWKTSVDLCAGKHEYKFVVDGQWRIDPANNKTINNGYGSVNSLLEVIG